MPCIYLNDHQYRRAVDKVVFDRHTHQETVVHRVLSKNPMPIPLQAWKDRQTVSSLTAPSETFGVLRLPLLPNSLCSLLILGVHVGRVAIPAMKAARNVSSSRSAQLSLASRSPSAKKKKKKSSRHIEPRTRNVEPGLTDQCYRRLAVFGGPFQQSYQSVVISDESACRLANELNVLAIMDLEEHGHRG